MLRIIIIGAIIFTLSCSSKKVEKKENIKSKVSKTETVNKLDIYQIDGKVITLSDMKKENKKYFDRYQKELYSAKSLFLKKEIEKYLVENNINEYLLTIPQEKNEIDIKNSPMTNSEKSRYTFVIFSDFECPFCSRSTSFEKEIASLKDVNVVFKHFPLSFHKNAQKAAIASNCAHKQNKFWEYHDLLFKNQTKLSRETYLELAENLNLNIENFKKCLDDSMSLVEVLKDQNLGIKIGVDGTPSYFLNGKKYDGKRSLEAFNYSKEKYLVETPALEKIEDLDTVVLKTSNETFTIKNIYNNIPKSRIDKFNLDLRFYQFNFLKQLSLTIIANKIFDKEAKVKGFKTTKEYVEALLKTVPKPKEDEIKALYEQYKGALKGKSYEESKEEIKEYLISLEQKKFFANKREQLIKKYDAKFLLTMPRMNIDITDSPMIGNRSAKNTIIIFSDFQCPYCARAKSLESEISKLDNVKLVFKHFPLSFHENAKPAALASYCAYKQNKFWEYHNLLFENQKHLSVTNLLVWIEKLGLDIEKFNKCFDSEEAKIKIKRDIEDGVKAKVEGTPTFFINGIKYDGNYNIESIKKELK